MTTDEEGHLRGLRITSAGANGWNYELYMVAEYNYDFVHMNQVRQFYKGQMFAKASLTSNCMCTYILITEKNWLICKGH